MALPNPWHVPNALGKSVTGPAPKPLPNPWHIPNALGQDITGTPPVYSPGAPVAPAAPAPPPPPPPPDFNALTLSDAQYTTNQNQINQQNTLNLEQLLKGFRGTSQSYQDNANAHGALFSGAAVNAQRSAAQSYADQQRQQALNKQQADSNNYQNVFQRLIQQLAGGQ